MAGRPELPERCVPCEGGVPPLGPDAALARMPHVPDWRLADARLRRAWTFRDFAAALAFVNRVGALAEAEGHHPDVHLTGWNRVELELWTHAAGGLTDNDFVLAAKIDALGAAPATGG